MLSRDLNRLTSTLDNWVNGKSYPDEGEFLKFYRELKVVAAKANLMELGLDPDFFKIAAACNEPGSNVRLFPTPRQRQITGASS